MREAPARGLVGAAVVLGLVLVLVVVAVVEVVEVVVVAVVVVVVVIVVVVIVVVVGTVTREHDGVADVDVVVPVVKDVQRRKGDDGCRETQADERRRPS
jgi:hypothetical protein